MITKNRRGLSWGLVSFTLALLFFASFISSAVRLYFSGGVHNLPVTVSKRVIAPMEVISVEFSASPPTISIRETVIFPDEAAVFLKYPPSASLFTKEDIHCVYLPSNASRPQQLLPPSSLDLYNENHQVVRCPLPPRGAILSLAVKHNGNLAPVPIYRWDSLAYEALIDRDNTTLVFVKGLNLRGGRIADSSRFKCVFGFDLSNPKFALQADVVSVAQEIVRCRTPLSILNTSFLDSIKVSVRVVGRRTLGSIARLTLQRQSSNQPVVHKQHKMCVCTMLRNQARFLREWITYHTHVGVERWFIYDNNSNDDIEDVIGALVETNHNITRRIWPWVKTQEAGLAHCAINARDSCEWVGFVDVDEFFHLPKGASLRDVLGDEWSTASDVGELRVPCHNFGPSGLKTIPKNGVTAGYTCRVAAPERHKSIVRPEALHFSLLNVVHHFRLKDGLKHVNMNRSDLVINHYKYQVWEVFKEKFHRRVATYVSDWQQDRNVGSKDRAPGLGTKAVEPSDWSTRFCEVKDTGLRNRVYETFSDPVTGVLPWEDRSEMRSRG